jgi:tRNA-dihydrouridine synthase 1
MIHAQQFVLSQQTSYRDEFFLNHPCDKPLIAQFCANDPKTLFKAATIVAEMGFIDAVDLNLGCPQGIAKKGQTLCCRAL